MTRPAAGGRLHTSAVSIRSGRGSMTHDRVMRFTRVFDTPVQATDFATEQALAWVGDPLRAPDRTLHLQEQ